MKFHWLTYAIDAEPLAPMAAKSPEPQAEALADDSGRGLAANSGNFVEECGIDALQKT